MGSKLLTPTAWAGRGMWILSHFCSCPAHSPACLGAPDLPHCEGCGKAAALGQGAAQDVLPVLFYCEVVQHWNGLPREVVETLKIKLDTVLGSLP